MKTTKQKKQNLGKILVWGALAGGLLCLPAQAQPIIEISGLPGAEHWVWKEGIQRNSGPSGVLAFADHSSTSGWMEGGPNNYYNRISGTNNPGTVAWDLHAPADMSSNTKIYFRGSSSHTGLMSVLLNGDAITPENAQFVSTSNNFPIYWIEWQDGATSIGQGISTGELSSGTNTFTYLGTAASNINRITSNGVLLYDGDPVLRSTEDNGTGRYWLQNPGSASSPVISETALTPIFNIDNLGAGNQVFYFLNGNPYTPGTPIEAGLNYELVVAVLASSDENSNRIAFSGANFSIIPEPGIYALGLGLMAAILILLRRRSRA